MTKYVLAVLCGTSITGSVYMAGWGSPAADAASLAAKNASAACSSCDTGDCCAASGVTATPMVSTAGLIDVGNTKCIVMGEDVTKDLFVDYQGKLYHICCSSCVADFQKDPEKYVKALEADPAKFGVPKK